MNGGPRLDLHVHSRHSPDSRLDLAEIVDRLEAAGLDGFALTDHNTVDGHAELARIASDRPRLLLLPGIEVSTREGHLLVYGISELPPVRRPVVETLAWVRARNGVAVPSHPSRLFHGIGLRRARTLPVSALETRNGHTGASGNRSVERVAAQRGIGGTGGSDVHDVGDLGRCATEFPQDARDLPSILEALRSGRVHPVGRSLTPAERFRLAFHHATARAARGFRPI